MEPDPSSRAAARRIVEEVLAEHAARAAPLDGVAPVTIVERPDTPAWRAARRIVEETLAEHAARAMIPPKIRVEVVVDLDEYGVEVLVDLDESRPSSDQRVGPDTAEDGPEPAVVSVVAPIERDVTPARSARRIVQSVLDDHGVDPESAGTRPEAPMAFEIDPDPDPLPEPVGSSADEGTAVVLTGSGSGPTGSHAESTESEPEPGPTVDGASPEAAGDPEDMAGAVVPIDDALLRAAIPDRLFAADPDPGEAAVAIDGPTEGPAPDATPSLEDAPPPPMTATSRPPSLAAPDAPVTIASRIVAEVLAERAQAALDARDADPEPEPEPDPEPAVAPAATDASDLPAEPRDLPAEPGDLPDRPVELPGATETLVLDTGTGAQRVPAASSPAPVSEPDRGSDPAVDPDASAAEELEELEERPPGAANGRVPAMNTPDGADPGSSAGLLTVEAAPEDVRVLDPVAHDPQVEHLPAEAVEDELWADEPSSAIVAEDELAAQDEYGQWPDPIVPPRRTGRWLITTVLSAVSLAFLLPLAIGALRDLVSFS